MRPQSVTWFHKENYCEQVDCLRSLECATTAFEQIMPLLENKPITEYSKTTSLKILQCCAHIALTCTCSLPQALRNRNYGMTHRQTDRQIHRHTSRLPYAFSACALRHNILRQGKILFSKFSGATKVPALHRVVQSGTSD